MKIVKLTCFLLLSFLVFTSCKKEEGEPNPTPEPNHVFSVEITSIELNDEDVSVNVTMESNISHDFVGVTLSVSSSADMSGADTYYKQLGTFGGVSGNFSYEFYHIILRPDVQFWLQVNLDAGETNVKKSAIVSFKLSSEELLKKRLLTGVYKNSSSCDYWNGITVSTNENPMQLEIGNSFTGHTPSSGYPGKTVKISNISFEEGVTGEGDKYHFSAEIEGAVGEGRIILNENWMNVPINSFQKTMKLSLSNIPNIVGYLINEELNLCE